MKFLLSLSLLVLANAASATCEAVTVGDLTVSGAWSRASFSADRPGVVYLTISNEGAEEDVLTGLATPAAAMPMLHETVVKDDVASMPHVMAIPVPPSSTVELAPGGFHAMLMDLAAPLEEGASFPVTLTFERAGEVVIEAEVLPLASKGPDCG